MRNRISLLLLIFLTSLNCSKDDDNELMIPCRMEYDEVVEDSSIGKIRFFTPLKGYVWNEIVVNGTQTDLKHAFKTDDGGLTWQEVNLPEGILNSRTAWYSVDYGQNNPDVITLTQDSTYLSVDGGLSWTDFQDEIDQQLFTDGRFFDSLNGYRFGNYYWSSGSKPFIYSTTSDGGITWTSNTPDLNLVSPQYPTGFDAFSMTNVRVIISSGVDYHLDSVYVTTDGGLTWNLQYEHDKNVKQGDISRVKFVTASNGFIYGMKNLIRTTDGGFTWNDVSGPFFAFSEYPPELQFLDEMTGYALSKNYTSQESRIYKTTDGGLSWTLMSEITWYVNRLSVLDSGNIWFTKGQDIYYTNDEFATYEIIATIPFRNVRFESRLIPGYPIWLCM